MEKREFNKGDKVWYTNMSGMVLDGVIDGWGEKNEQLVYDVKIASGDLCWGYADQFKKR